MKLKGSSGRTKKDKRYKHEYEKCNDIFTDQ